MPLQLDTPLTFNIAKYAVKNFTVDLENNFIHIGLALLADDNSDVGRRVLHLPIYDDLGNIIMPSAWTEEDPNGTQLYRILERFLFMGLQDQRGDSGLGAGTII